MPPKVAAVTMAYNEQIYLPIWARHYARQVGADHCYIVDHGSTDKIDVLSGINILRIPRSPHDDVRRALFIGSLVEGLLEYYDWVVHTDVDELVLVDPDRHPHLASYCQDAFTDTVTAIGLDVQHVPELEPPLRSDTPVGAQRQWVRFTSAMCKPVLTRRPIVWSPGFHSADAPIAFGSLYLFHLRWADETSGISRLEKTRNMPWGDPAFGAHQRISSLEWSKTFNAMAAFPRQDAVSFDPAAAPMSEWLERTRASTAGREEAVYKLDLHINAAELWAVPPRFRARL